MIKASYSPLFSHIVDSSLWAQADSVRIVFVTLIAIKDSDQVARVSAYALGRKCWPNESDVRGTERRALEALKVLSEPDTQRVEKQAYDGRRIQKVEDGYLILNGLHYEDLMRKYSERARKAKWARDNRAKKTSKPLNGERAYVKAVENGNEAEADRIAARGTPNKESQNLSGSPAVKMVWDPAQGKMVPA